MLNKLYISIIAALVLLSTVACEDSVSYSELLNQEEEATNWYMAQQTICMTIPTDTVFITGENAPFYRMDEDGYIYMQVVNPGTKDNKAKTNELIYFRFSSLNLKDLYNGYNPSFGGNSDNMSTTSTSFRFDNLTLSSSYEWGSGIQLPLHYLGVDCEVNLVLRSYYGFSANQASCVPYLYNVRYFRNQM